MQESNTILIADDMEINRVILRELFQYKYDIIEASNGVETLELLDLYNDSIAMVLLDVIMPLMDGFQVLENMSKRGKLKRIPVVFITGANATELEKRGYDLGVSDIINKPFDPYVVKRRVDNVIDLYRHKNNLEQLVSRQTEKIEKQALKIKESNDFIIDAFSTVVEFRDMESGEHVKRIKYFTNRLLQRLSKASSNYDLSPDTIEKITSASAMHDIGKIAIPDNVLLKPGRLTPEEFEIMKTHTIKGCEMLKNLTYIDDKSFYDICYDICRHHHERYDGRGYPDGLIGDDIPVSAQAVSIADVYDALVSVRVYKKAYTHDEAIKMIVNGECGVFSDTLIDCLLDVEGQFKEAH